MGLEYNTKTMHLKRLSLKNFRNISNGDFLFNPEFNFIFGKNAQGKTNIIESIFYLSQLKSFRQADRTELIAKEKGFANLSAEFQKDDVSWEISITLTAEERKLLVNQKRAAAGQNYYELIPLVLFEPRHIYLFRDSPSKRRDYLNRALFLQNASYLSLWRDYEKVIAQKNRLLKDGGALDLLAVWNDRLVTLAAQIVKLRLDWFDAVNAQIKIEYQELSRTGEVLALEFLPKIQSGLAAESLRDKDIGSLMQFYAEAIDARRGEELLRRESLVGPHRDDFKAKLSGRDVGTFGSQGENRSVLIALKLTQLKMFEKKFGKTPLFLLDDVASELDQSRCDYLFSYLRDEKTQVFITTTENHVNDSRYAGHCSAFEIVNGGLIATQKTLA